MAISFVGSATAIGGDGENISIDLTEIVGLAEDDYVIVAYNPAENSDIDCSMVTADYAELADLFADGTNDTNLGVFGKFMDETPDTTAVVQGTASVGSGISALAMAFRGVDLTTPLDVTPATDTAAGSAIPNPPAITPVTDGAEIVVIGSSSVGDAAVTPPSGYGNDVQVTSNSGRDTTTAGASRNLATAAPEDPAAWTDWVTASNRTWCAVTIALRPAEGGGGGATVAVPNANTITLQGQVPSVAAATGATVSAPVVAMSFGVQTPLAKGGASVSPSPAILNILPRSSAVIAGDTVVPATLSTITLDMQQVFIDAAQASRAAGVSIWEGVSFPEGVTDIRTTVGRGGTNDESE